jgi:histone-lysine N-methyltransferase SETMAR
MEFMPMHFNRRFNDETIAAKVMPYLPTEEQKNNHVNVCRDLQEELKNDPQFLTEIVTSDESWCYSYNPESKHQSSQWKSPNSHRPKKAQQVCSSVKTKLIFLMLMGL